jgi:YVTN family beta-propeller protein
MMTDRHVDEILRGLDAPGAPDPGFAEALLRDLEELWRGAEVSGPVARPRRSSVRPSLRGPLLVAAAALALAAASTGFLIFAFLHRAPAPAGSLRSRVVARSDAGRGPAGVAVGLGAVWVGHSAQPEVWRFAPGGRMVPTRITTSRGPAAVGAGRVWLAGPPVEDGQVHNEVVWLDPGQGTGAIRVGRSPIAIAATEDAVWVANQGDGTVSRIDPSTDAVVATIPVDASPVGISAGAGGVWVASGGDRAPTVSRIDPTSNTVVATIPLSAAPSSIAAGDGGVWVVSSHDREVLLIDPATDRVAGTVTTFIDPPESVAVAPDAIWVAGGRYVSRLDPYSLRLVELVAVGGDATAVAVGAGSVWAIDVAAEQLVEIRPGTDGTEAVRTIP